MITKLMQKFPPWSLCIFFYAALVFVPNNKIMGILVAATTVFFTYKTKSLLASLFYTILLCLPFTKGKGFQFEIINTWQTKLTIPYTFDFDITFWGLAMAILVYGLIRNRRRFTHVLITQADVLLFLFYLSLIPSVLFSSYPHIAVLGLMELTFLVLLYFVTRQVRSFIDLTIVNMILGIQLSFQGIMAIGQFILRRPLGLSIEGSGGELLQNDSIEYAFEQVGFFRSRGTFDHSNTLGTFASSLVPFFVILLLYKKNTTVERTLYSISALLGTIGVIASGSRTSIAIILLFFGIFFIVGKKRWKPLLGWKPWVGKITLVAGLFAMTTIIIPRMMQLAGTLQEGGGLTYRMTLFSHALSIAQNNFFGVGLGLFPKEVFTNIGTFTSYPAQPHNLFAQIAAEGGLISLVFFLLFLLYKIKKPHDAYTRAVVSSITIMLILSQVYPFLVRSAVFPYLMLFLAILP